MKDFERQCLGEPIKPNKCHACVYYSVANDTCSRTEYIGQICLFKPMEEEYKKGKINDEKK